MESLHCVGAPNRFPHPPRLAHPAMRARAVSSHLAETWSESWVKGTGAGFRLYGFVDLLVPLTSCEKLAGQLASLNLGS